jgi:hypothetical protein
MDPQPTSSTSNTNEPTTGGSVVLAWLFVGIPLLWGVSQTFVKALALFE